jgi:xanthine dehydrogenase small subunit
MRDYLVLFINGKEHRVSGEDAFMPLSTYLRQEQGATGTKVVCEEGDCGACSVILGTLAGSKGEIGYRPINSCIQFMYQLDCTHVVTIEGLKHDGELNPVQNAMVDCHGAQCGYCTPGFVVSMCAMFDRKNEVNEQDIKDGLTGNLCRCTGYEPIINAGLAVEAKKVLKLRDLYPAADIVKTFAEHKKIPIEIKTKERTYANPVELAQAAKFKGANPGCTIVAGGTDVCVYWNKRGIEPAVLMSVSNLPGLDDLKIENGTMVVGARTTLAQLEDFCQEHFKEFARILWLFGAPQIRHAATLAGNIANGSPIADSLPMLFVTDSEVELQGTSGSRRVNINKLFKGYKQLDIKPDELIARIHIPLPKKDEILKLYKVSKRKHLDISAFTAAFRFTLAGDKIERISIAYGGVAPVILRLPKTEAFLAGKNFNYQTMVEAGALARQEITPISDVRGSADFRFTLAENILLKLYLETQEAKELACRP